MYRVTETYRGETIIARRPPYPRPGGGRFALARCTQEDLRYLYDTLALTEAVEYVEDYTETQAPTDETIDEAPKKTARRTRRTAAEPAGK